jgi:EmrB/QacA subfamily drug resistance transporter
MTTLTARTAPGATARQKSPAVALAVLSMAVFMSSLDLFIVNLAFPYIGHDFHGSTLSGLSWVLNAYTIVFAAVLVPAGRWADRVGRRFVFTLGLAVFVVGSAACGLAPDLGFLIGARVVQAVGAGLMVPTSLSLLLALVPTEGRARAIGTWSAVGALGAGLGPVFGGLLVQLDWRWVFWVNLPVGIIALVLARRTLTESRDPQAGHRPDLLGAGVLAAAVGAAAFGLVKAPDWGWASWQFGVAIAAAIAGVVFVLRHSAHHPAPVIELPLLRVRSFSGAFAVSVLYYAGFGAFALNTVEFLTGAWHFSAIHAGLSIAPGPLCVLPVARLVTPRLVAKLGAPGRVAVLGALVNMSSQLLLLASIGAHPSYAAEVLPAQIIGGIGVGLSIPSLLGAGTSGIPPAWFGVGSGILNMARQLGTVLGVAALIGLLSSTGGDPLTPYRHGIELIIGFFAASAVVAAIALAGKTRPALRASREAAPPTPAATRIDLARTELAPAGHK